MTLQIQTRSPNTAHVVSGYGARNVRGDLTLFLSQLYLIPDLLIYFQNYKHNGYEQKINYILYVKCTSDICSKPAA